MLCSRIPKAAATSARSGFGQTRQGDWFGASADAGYVRIRKKEGEPPSIGIRKKGWGQIYHAPYLAGKNRTPSELPVCISWQLRPPIMKKAGVEILSENKPPLIQSDRPAFWTSKELKAGDMALTRNLNGSRLAGVYATGSDFLAVYSLGSNQMCWSEVFGIEKAKLSLQG